jgi:hypothetical protein
MKSFSNLPWRTRKVLKDLGGCVLILAISVISFSLWIFVLEYASKGFFELWDPLGLIFILVYIGLTGAAIATLQNYSWKRKAYIIVHLSVTDEQREALVKEAIAGGYENTYGGLQACVGNMLELALKERFAEMLARHAAWRARIMSKL